MRKIDVGVLASLDPTANAEIQFLFIRIQYTVPSGNSIYSFRSLACKSPAKDSNVYQSILPDIENDSPQR